MRSGVRTWALSLLCGLAATACGDRPPAVVLPADLANFDPELRALIESRAADVVARPKDAAAVATLGLVYEAQRQWLEARACFERAHELEPEQPVWIHHVALCLHHNGRSGDALSFLEGSRAAVAQDGPTQHLLGTLLLQTGASDEAAQAFNVAIAGEPERPEGYAGLGQALTELGNNEEALVALERAVALDPTYASAQYLLGLAYRSTGRETEAQAALALGAGAHARIMPDRLSEERMTYLVSRVDRLQAPQQRTKGSRRAAAQANADAVLKHAPDDAEALVLRARALMQKGSFAEALASLEQVLAADPDNVDGLVCSGISLAQIGRAQAATRALRHAESLAPDSVEVHTSLASHLLQLGQAQDALLAAERAIELDPRSAEGHGTLAMARMSLGQHALAKAGFARALQLKPKNRQMIEAYGRALHQMGDNPGARTVFEQLTSMAPRYGLGYAYLARTEAALGQMDAARAHLARAHDLGAKGQVMARVQRTLADGGGQR
ncbi:MAG: tetratricopeptide (TPR) repeat protein [Chlamydiales bacterium]